jgi:hypothetical protein
MYFSAQTWRGPMVFATSLALSFPAYAELSFVQNGRAGFVVSDFKYILADDAEKTGACPDGMARNVAEIFAMTSEGKRRKGESDEAYGKRMEEGGWKVATAANGQNLCMNPEAGTPDPNFRTVRSTSIPVDGIDIDGIDSRPDSPSPRTCPHQDSIGKHGERGIDNQFSRVVGCTRSFQPNGQSNGFAIEMLTGAWGIVISLEGVDDIRNDESVDVGIYANADPIQLSPTRNPLAYATYAIDQDPRFRATTRGRIKDGVLTTEPTDVRFRTITNSLHMERPLRHARLQATLSKDGVLSGYLAGYTPVEDMYDYQFGYRHGKTTARQDSHPAGPFVGTAGSRSQG